MLLLLSPPPYQTCLTLVHPLPHLSAPLAGETGSAWQQLETQGGVGRRTMEWEIGWERERTGQKEKGDDRAERDEELGEDGEGEGKGKC